MCWCHWRRFKKIKYWKYGIQKWNCRQLKIKSSLHQGIEHWSPAWQAGILTTILTRTTHQLAFYVFLKRIPSVKTEKSLMSKRLKCFQVIVFISFGVCPVIKSTNTSHWNCFPTQKFSRKIQPLWQSSKMFSSNETFI